MDAATEKLFEQALDLPPSERDDLASALIASLDSDDAHLENVDPTWSATIARRVAEIESGTARLVPWAEVRRRLFEP